MASAPHVGTLGEKPLHAALKRWLAEPGDLVEQPVDGFVVDLVRDDVLIEVQTRGFATMKRKLGALLDGHVIRLVHPVAVEKQIVKLDDAGEELSRRRSPRRGSAVDVFAELVSFPELVEHPGLTVEVVLVREEELRRHDGDKAWRRRGWVVEERRLLEVVDHLVLDTPAALAALLPSELPARFTTADLADALGRRRRLAQQMAYCLRRLGVVEMIDKEGNAIVYRRAPGTAQAATGG